MTEPEQEREQRRQLTILAIALVLAMCTWFSTAAVLGQLRETWDLSRTAGAWLTIMVQIGFVAGAAVSSVTNLADRIPPRRLMLYGTMGAAAANLAVVVGSGYAVALPARFLTGCFLAAVYPPSLKAMSSWYREGRGFALGVMIGALTLGSAVPHLINALGGLDWTVTLVAASALTVGGGLIAEFAADDGPYVTRAAAFDPRQLRAITRNPRFALASAGYFGHMWELYAMWAWIAAFYTDVFTVRTTGGDPARLAGFAAFAVIGIGAVGSAYAGRLSDRSTRAEAAAVALRWSAALSLVVGFLEGAPLVIVLGAGLVWGFWVVADSAQFSTVVTEVTDPDYIGTALTVQLAIGFVLTVFTIFLVPVIRDAAGWGWAFLLLAPGPALGGWAMRKLRDLPAPQPPKAQTQTKPEVFVSPFF
ncbi:MAG: MFS transporter [Actinomycetota bacterium]